MVLFAASHVRCCSICVHNPFRVLKMELNHSHTYSNHRQPLPRAIAMDMQWLLHRLVNNFQNPVSCYDKTRRRRNVCKSLSQKIILYSVRTIRFVLVFPFDLFWIHSIWFVNWMCPSKRCHCSCTVPKIDDYTTPTWRQCFEIHFQMKQIALHTHYSLGSVWTLHVHVQPDCMYCGLHWWLPNTMDRVWILYDENQRNGYKGREYEADSIEFLAKLTWHFG